MSKMISSINKLLKKGRKYPEEEGGEASKDEDIPRDGVKSISPVGRRTRHRRQSVTKEDTKDQDKSSSKQGKEEEGYADNQYAKITPVGKRTRHRRQSKSNDEKHLEVEMDQDGKAGVTKLKPTEENAKVGKQQGSEDSNEVIASEVIHVLKHSQKEVKTSPKDSKDEENEDEKEEIEDEQEKKTEAKRKRRQSKADAYQPLDFKSPSSKSGPQISVGRGKKLGEIEAVKTNVTGFSVDDDEMTLAHKLLYKMRGRPAKKDLRRNILEFSGYLRPLESGETGEDVEEEDEEAEADYSSRAFKLSAKQLKSLCDLFTVDRMPDRNEKQPLGKDELVDRLLDFLGAPDEDFLVSASPEPKKAESPTKNKTSSPPKKRSRIDGSGVGDRGKEGDSEVHSFESWAEKASIEGAFYLVRDHEKGEEPSDAALRQWVQAYVSCFDMDTATTKHCLRSASLKFGVNMRNRRDKIREYLTSEI